MKKRIIAMLLAIALVMTGICVIKTQTAKEVKASDANEETIIPDTPDIDMLSIKIQPRQNDPKGTPYDFTDDTMDLRLVSSVNGIGYASVGFEVYFTSNDNAKPEDTEPIIFETSSVLKRISAKKTNVTYKYSPKVVDTSSEYFVTGVIMNILYKNWDNDFYVRAFCTELETGNKVYGAGRYFNVNEMHDNSTINITLPTSTEPAFNASTKEVTDSITIGSNSTATSAVLKYYDAESDYAYLKVSVPAGATVDGSTDKTMLKSASKVTVGGESTVYRNLESSYENQGKDSSWYSVYDGDETEFVIATSADLYGLADKSTSYNFAPDKLYIVSDITAISGEATDWATSAPANNGWWTPISDFRGTFDGQGHTISGLYMNKNDADMGFFQLVTGGTVKDFRLTNTYIYSGNTTATSRDVGIIAGEFSGTMKGVYTDAILEVTKNTASYKPSGGLVGRIGGNATISDCQFDGTIDTDSGFSGGVAGYCTTACTIDITNCQVTGTINLNTKGGDSGGIFGETGNNITLNITDSMFAGDINFNSGASTTNCGLLVGAVSNTNTLNLTDSCAVPLEGFSDILGVIVSGTLSVNGSETKYTASNNCTQLDSLLTVKEPIDISWFAKDKESSTYTISDKEQLYGFAWLHQVRTGFFNNKTIKLGKDITVNTGTAAAWATTAPDSVWTPISDFKGIFDGQGYNISGLYMNGAGNMGLFKNVVGGTIKKLGLINTYIYTTGAYNGSIAGTFNGTMEDVYTNAYLDVKRLDTSNKMSGGLAGGINGNASFQRCQFAGTINSESGFIGGVAGYCNTQNTTINVNNCQVTGIINLNTKGGDSGGIIGETVKNITLNITDSMFEGDINFNSGASTNNCGLLVGALDGSNTLNLTDSYAVPVEGFSDILGVIISGTVSVNGSATQYTAKNNCTQLDSLLTVQGAN